MAELTITRASHHFKVSKISVRGREAVESFAKKFIQYGVQRQMGRYVTTALKVFASALADRSEYRFHINQYEKFLEHLKLHYLDKDGLVEYRTLVIPKVRKITLAIKEGWAPRQDQVPAIDYILEDTPNKRKLLEVQTGKGKSFMSMYAGMKLECAAAYIVRPMYIDKWVIDFQKTYDLEPEDLMVIRGSNQLQALLFLAAEGELKAKILLISNKTLQNWIKLYERIGDETLMLGYACRPDEFFELLGVGFRVIDEVHQDFHLNFKIDLNTHVERSLSLSATLVSDDAFLNRMYEMTYPAATRFKGFAYDKYISATAVLYRFKRPDKIRCIDHRQKTYSHHLFEESVMKDKEILANYIKMVRAVIDSEYISDYRPGSRMLIYGAGTDFCTLLTTELRKWYPDLRIERYCGTLDDPYDNLMQSDICVSTVSSAGTGVDIPFLRVVLLTHAISSTQSNIQGFGRLRNNLPEDIVPRFVWTVNIQTPKHMEYHDKKMDILKDKALDLNALDYGEPL
jgi:hypothetical protein